MKYTFFFLAVILLSACKFNGQNRIRFVDIEQDAEAQALWRPDGGEKQEDANVTDVLDAGNLEPQTLEACQNSCFSMYGYCYDSDSCAALESCMHDCTEKFNPRDAGTDANKVECTNSCYARFGCHGDAQCQDLLVTCLLDCGEELFPHDAQ